jgi:hypothetical protein
MTRPPVTRSRLRAGFATFQPRSAAPRTGAGDANILIQTIKREARKGAEEREIRRVLHGMRGLVPAECAGKIVFDFLLGVAAVLIAELNADAGGSFTLRALGSHPDHAPGNRQLLLLAHEIQQHENFIAQPVIAVRWYEQAAILDEGHVGEIQRALVLDGKRQETRFIAWTSQFLRFPR